MKPAWDRLIEDFQGAKSSLVADVDCTGTGESLCQEKEVKGYPTIKYGDPSDLKDYQGERDYDSLKKFADENIGPRCGPASLEECGDDEKALIEGLMSKDESKLQEEAKKVEKEISSKKKAYEKKKRKYNTKAKDFEAENAEYLADKEIYVKEKEKFEKKGDKNTPQDKKKQAAKDKKMNAKFEEMEKKKEKDKVEKTALQDELKGIQEFEKTSGLKHMKAIIKMKAKNEL